MPEWTVRFFREGDEEGLLSLLTTAFDRWPAAEIDVSPLEHLRWKLRSDPLALPHHAVAEADGRIVGGRILLVRGAKVDDQVVLSYVGVDNAVHPDFRRRGLLTEIVPYRFDELKRLFALKFGLQTRLPSSERIRKLIGAELVGNHLRALVAPAGLPAFAGEHSAWRIRTVPCFDERLDRFWEIAAQAFRFVFQKDAAFANWRYADRRAGAFTIKLAEQGDELLGYAVLRTSHGRSYIVDLLALPERTDVLRSLVCDGVRTLSEAGAEEIECALPHHHPYRNVLRELGFRDGKRRIRPNVLAAGMPPDQLAFLTDPKAGIHLVLGDFDLV